MFQFSLCGWAAGVDSIVFGTIADLQPVQDVFVSGGEVTSVRSDGLCTEGYLVPSFDITLKSVDTPWGSAQESIIVRVPALEVGEWNPMVLIDPTNGSIDWRGGAPLEIGQRVGVSLVYVGEAKLWMAKGPLLAVWADEASDSEFLTAQDWNECIAGPTLNGLSMKEFGETLASCDAFDPTVATQAEEFRGYDDDWFAKATPEELIWRLGSQCSVVDMNAPVCTTEEECAKMLAP
ncbi:MAG: hypothetical protein AUK47_16575 [Deltaproteobacteria bacterium CG2_30_63_29]|nr:MAG: hypothetical protein AUK47_16575 [Deltaproteobacteria bacterium CG2_30_63_29]PJB41978.1 MAG: hypothetical protein CO108_12450 [Deltaproteobacteria bacterium CG_4_9_14_3_um_filter_63_12]